MKKETPITDNALHGVWYRGSHGSAIPAMCRELEIIADDLAGYIQNPERNYPTETIARFNLLKEQAAAAMPNVRS
jgi:hypothetical protein